MIRCLLLLAFLIAGGVPSALGQVPAETFGPLDIRSLPVAVKGLVHVETLEDGSQRALMLSASGHRILDILIPAQASAEVLDTIVPSFPFNVLRQSVPQHALRQQQYILRTDSLVLYALRRTTKSSWEVVPLLPLDRMPSLVHVADLNGDGLEDLLLVDEQEPGILPLFQRQNGSWRKGRLIASELPTSQVGTVHLNNDGLLDLLAYDWVRSEIHLIYGVGKERFLDQGGFLVEGMVDGIFIDPVTGDHPLRVTLFDRSRSGLTYLEMDDRGDLVEVTRQVVPDSVRTVYAVHNDKTHRSTFILVTDSTVGIVPDAFIARTPTAHTVGLPGKVTSSWLPGIGSASFILGADRYCRVWSYGSAPSAVDSVILATPRRPVAVLVRDHNADGHDDLAFISGRSGTISIVWGYGNGTYSGAEEFAGPDLPRTAIGQSTPDTLSRFYISHTSPSGVSVVEIEWQDQSVTTSRIPMAGIPELIGEVFAPNGSVSLAAVHRASEGTVTFATYERIRQDSFLEQTIKLGPPAVLFGASMGYVDRDTIPDAILIYRPDDSSAVALSVVYGDSSHQPDRPPVARALPVKDPRATYLWQTDANNDSIPDMIAVFPKSAQEVYLLLSSRDSLYANAVLIDSLVAIDHRQLFAVRDADGDSLPDLFAVLRSRGGLGWWRNLGGGAFAPWEVLVYAPDISAFAFGGFFHPDGGDLVVTRQRMNAAVVYSKDVLPWGRR